MPDRPKPPNVVTDERSFRCDELLVSLADNGFAASIDNGPALRLDTDCARALALWLLWKSGAEIRSVISQPDNGLIVRMVQ